ncbi:MAG: bifunctional DNA-formamidopyrimidine glycosylase/DNA-(apurinic or apyrimidinic site) lyase [Actinobacteria bacterium]|nr:bifunctional DNA-formamidopyrimidine glycosylase/DNA-(apurinic or apyrimidinic site) lyase [Actinomycetota bacterium]
MPELPEVETIRRQLEPELLGSVIVDCAAFDHPKFTPAHLAVGHRVVGIRRRGKYLLVGLAAVGAAPDPTHELVIHLGMTGRLWIEPDDHHALEATDQPYQRARWRLDDGRTMVFSDVRRFGRIAVTVRNDHRGLNTLAQMGPEPFDPAFQPEPLRRGVNASRQAVKTQLLSQRLVAGLGNIYADEALWAARVHPGARRITRAQAERLSETIREVLAAGIAAGGTTLRDYRDASGATGRFQMQLRCYGLAGHPCERCGTPLARTVIDARSTTFCRTCQRR